MRTATANSPDQPLPELCERRWQAVLDRTSLAGDPFLYAVRTTGVYCLPICGARRPNKSNVVLFASNAEAEAAGFRACKRCRPDREVEKRRATPSPAPADG